MCHIYQIDLYLKVNGDCNVPLQLFLCEQC